MLFSHHSSTRHHVSDDARRSVRGDVRAVSTYDVYSSRLLSVVLMAEEVGFEPTGVYFKTGELATRCNKPLCHSSNSGVWGRSRTSGVSTWLIYSQRPSPLGLPTHIPSLIGSRGRDRTYHMLINSQPRPPCSALATFHMIPYGNIHPLSAAL